MGKVLDQKSRRSPIDLIKLIRDHAANRNQSLDRLAYAPSIENLFIEIICREGPSFHAASLIRPKSPTCTLADEPQSEPNFKNKNKILSTCSSSPVPKPYDQHDQHASFPILFPPQPTQIKPYQASFHAHGPNLLHLRIPLLHYPTSFTPERRQ